ncbi:MAG: hypothetical protein KDI44_07590 [Thiothrix sp.]|nr:hypothetical protein [Thiothrix sp.]HPQ95799.1 hypothetical protein [Thiolinea sp.]
MTEDQMQQWAKQLLDQQRQAFAEQISQMQAAQQQPAPEPVDFDEDPEKAVRVLMQQHMDKMMQPFRQQLETLSQQLQQPKTDPLLDALRKQALPDKDDAFDAEMVGIGAMTWGDVRKTAESRGDIAALKQYASELTQFRNAGKKATDMAVPAARARVAFPQADEPEAASEEQVNADLTRLMQGKLTKADFDRKYGVNA